MEHIENEFSELELGDQKEVDAGILSIAIGVFGQSVAKTDDIIDFRKINRILDGCIPEVLDKGGILVHMGPEASTSLFIKEPGNALSCALAIFSLIGELADEEKIDFEKIAIALCYGSVTVGMVGYKGFMVTLPSSESILLCSLLQERASVYSAKVLATETFLDQIPRAKEKYNHRMLGVVYLSGSKRKEMVFDIFEADEPDIRNFKRRTKNMFEKGVEMFLVSRFAEARNYFLEVIRTDRRDLAAKEYLLRCDDYIHGIKDSKAEEAVYFEIL